MGGNINSTDIYNHSSATFILTNFNHIGQKIGLRFHILAQKHGILHFTVWRIFCWIGQNWLGLSNLRKTLTGSSLYIILNLRSGKHRWNLYAWSQEFLVLRITVYTITKRWKSQEVPIAPDNCRIVLMNVIKYMFKGMDNMKLTARTCNYSFWFGEELHSYL